MNESLNYTLVHNSDHVAEVMLNLLIKMPELFKITTFKSIKHLVTTAICGSDIPVVNSEYSERFYKILNNPEKTSDRYRKAPNEQQQLANQLRFKTQKLVKGDFRDRDFLNQVGCTEEEFKLHISNQFTENMKWDNYGLYTWHIDHIEPLCSFDLTDLAELAKATNFKNLRPLAASENLEKAKEDRKKSIRK